MLGWALGINPFDQPNVQEAKDNTSRVLAEGADGLEDGSLDELLDGLAPPSYLAIMGYLPYDEAIDAAVERLRAGVIERYGVATTWGYGPRFLHSTGQYHKGGPPTGRFLQLVHDDDDRRGRARRGLRLPQARLRPGRRRPRDPALARPARRRVRLDAGDLPARDRRAHRTPLIEPRQIGPVVRR